MSSARLLELDPPAAAYPERAEFNRSKTGEDCAIRAEEKSIRSDPPAPSKKGVPAFPWTAKRVSPWYGAGRHSRPDPRGTDRHRARAGAGIGRGRRRGASDSVLGFAAPAGVFAGAFGRDQVPRSVDEAVRWLKTHFHQFLDNPLLDEVEDRGAAVRRSLDHWLDTVAESVVHGGPSTTAALRAIDAVLDGKNLVWAAIKGMASGLSRTVQVALVLLILLGLVLGPVLLVIALLALLVAGLVAAIRAATR